MFRPIESMENRTPSVSEIRNLEPQKSPETEKRRSVPRGRRERPCDACRRRKSKCVVTDGRNPCAACAIHNQECTYVEDPQPRKRKVEGQNSEENSGKRRSIASAPTRSANSKTTTAESTTGKGQLGPHSAPASEEPMFSTSRSLDSYIGPTTELEPLLLSLSTEDKRDKGEAVFKRADRRTGFLTQDLPSTALRARADNVQALDRIVGPHRNALLKAYLTAIDPSFPVVQSELFSKGEAFKSDTDPLLLAAMYLIALPWLNVDATKKRVTNPDDQELRDLAIRLFSDSLAQPTLSSIQAGLLLMQRPDIDSKALNMQTCSMAFEVGLHLDCSTWKCSTQERGLRKRLAWAIFMQDKWCSLIHGRPSLISKANWEVQPLLAEDLQPVTAKDAAAKLLPAHAGGEVARGRETFKQMVKLTEILATVLDTFFTLQAMREIDQAPSGGTRLILERAKPVQIRLKEWFAKLPSALKMDRHLHLAYFATEITLHRSIIRSLRPSALIAGQTSSNNANFMATNDTVPTLPTLAPAPAPMSSTALLSSAPTSSLQSTTNNFLTSTTPATTLTIPSSTTTSTATLVATNPSPTTATNTTTPDPYLTHICRSAAKTRLISAMDFINRLRPEHLTSFWYFPSSTSFSIIGTFGALLHATSPCREEADFYTARLREYRWTLGVSSTRNLALMRGAMGGLERVMGLVEGVQGRLPEAGRLGLDTRVPVSVTKVPVSVSVSVSVPAVGGGGEDGNVGGDGRGGGFGGGGGRIVRPDLGLDGDGDVDGEGDEDEEEEEEDGDMEDMDEDEEDEDEDDEDNENENASVGTRHIANVAVTVTAVAAGQSQGQGQEPRRTSNLSAASGLVSPSTSTSSADAAFDAYVDNFAQRRAEI
ncbi:hypothetical protein MMC25_006733 [Agyrium rufum]|nr:hypothetical protein [Agyrium rufum]